MEVKGQPQVSALVFHPASIQALFEAVYARNSPDSTSYLNVEVLARITDWSNCVWLFMGSGNLNLGPQAHGASALPTEPLH